MPRDPDTTGDCGHPPAVAARHRVGSRGQRALPLREAAALSAPAYIRCRRRCGFRRRSTFAFAGSARGLRWLDAYDAAGHRIVHSRQGSSSAPCSFVDPVQGLSGGGRRAGAGRRPVPVSALLAPLTTSVTSTIASASRSATPQVGSSSPSASSATSASATPSRASFSRESASRRPRPSTSASRHPRHAASRSSSTTGRRCRPSSIPRRRRSTQPTKLLLAPIAGAHRVRSVTGYDAAGAPVFTHKAATEKGGLCDAGGSFATEVQLDG